ncbi:hypothetical protein U2F10_01700 [Leptothoe sp. EHU-05/26/07-4]
MEIHRSILKNMRGIKSRRWLVQIFYLIFFLLVTPRIIFAQDQSAVENSQQITLEERLSILEERQELLVEAAERDLGRVYLIFSAVSAFFAIFLVFSGLRSFFDDRRRYRLEDQYMGEIRSMMGSFRDNIGMINSLIASLKETFNIQADITKKLQEIDQQIGSFDNYRSQEEMMYRSQVDTINTDFSKAFISCNFHKRNRELFKEEENRIQIHTFSTRLNTLELTGNLANLLSPVSSFVRGLSRFNEMNYQQAIEDLLKARNSAKAQLIAPLSQYGNWDADEIKRNLRILIDETYYHLGIMYYNTGAYDKAENEFADAHERYPLDFRSRIYIPELLFFHGNTDPQKVVDAFKSVEIELNNVTSNKRKQMSPTWEWCYAALKLRQGNIFLKKIFSQTFRSSSWSQIENNKLAIECFWEARDKNPKSPVVNFSLAQAMELDGKSVLWKDLTPKQLFKEAFIQFRNQAIRKTEPILLTMLYYCAAISCFGGKIQNDSPSTYLGLARQQLQKIPESILVFSPLNKVMSEHSVLLNEMEQLEIWWQEQLRR